MKALMQLIVIISVVLVTMSACAANKPADQPKSAVAPAPQTSSQTESNDVVHVRNVVNTRQVQLQNLYRRQSAISSMQGTLQIKLYITDQGVVQNNEVLVDSGMLNDEFVAAVKQEITTWRFLIREPLIYTFKVQFKKA